MSKQHDMSIEFIRITHEYFMANAKPYPTEFIDEVNAIIQKDPHEHSNRPCGTCQLISAILGKPFWCSRVAAEVKARYVVFWLFSQFIVQTDKRPPEALFNDDNIHIVRVTDGKIEEWHSEDKFWWEMDRDDAAIAKAATGEDWDDQATAGRRAEPVRQRSAVRPRPLPGRVQRPPPVPTDPRHVR